MFNFLFLFTGTTNDYERRTRGLRRVSGPYCEVFFFPFFIYVVLISYYFKLDYVTPSAAAAAAATAAATPPSPSPPSATAAAAATATAKDDKEPKKAQEMQRTSPEPRTFTMTTKVLQRTTRNQLQPSAQRQQQYLKHRFSFFSSFFFAPFFSYLLT